MSSNTFLTVDEVAENLKVTRQTVSKYIKQKDLNAIKINKSYRITHSDFENFLNRNSIVSEPIIQYSKKSKNCFLDYPNKTSEEDVIFDNINGYLNLTEKQHNEENNCFFFGDNYSVLKQLGFNYNGKVDLIYIDPPFGTGLNFSSIDKNHAYSDKLVNSEFLDFLRKRLLLLRDLMSENGSIYLHIDKKIGHYVKVIMDEIFGYNNFINDITRIKCNPKNFARNAYGNYSDMILFYAKNRDRNIWNDVKETINKDKLEELFPKVHPIFGRYTTNPLHAPGETIDGDTGKEWKGIMPPQGRHWRYGREELSRLDDLGLIEWSSSGNPRKIVLASEHLGLKVQDVWEFKDKGMSYVDYPTQKNHDLLKRIILNSSNENSIVLDCFAGSGGTLEVAHKLNRKWIGIDSSTFSYNTIKKQFKKRNILCNYFEYVTLT